MAAPGTTRHGTAKRRQVPPAGHRRSATLTAVVAAAAITLAACGSSGSTAGVPSKPAVGVRTWSVPGPYAAGTMRATLPDGDPVQLWYPVDRASVRGASTYTYQLKQWVSPAEADNPVLAKLPDSVPTTAYLDAPVARDTGASGDPSHAFPVVLFAHGYGSYPEQSSFLTDHLATWGFVVIAPEEQATDLASVLAGSHAPGALTAAQALQAAIAYAGALDQPGGRFAHLLDLARLAVVGHSLGGGAAITLAATDHQVKTYVALAPAPGTAPTTHTPGLVMVGSADQIVSPASVRATYAALPTPKRLVVIAGGGHNVFDDICTIHTGSTRLVTELKAALGAAGGLGTLAKLATDGCFPPDVNPVHAYPLIDQAVTAQLRDGLGLDPAGTGFGPGLGTAFPGVTATVTAAG